MECRIPPKDVREGLFEDRSNRLFYFLYSEDLTSGGLPDPVGTSSLS